MNKINLVQSIVYLLKIKAINSYKKIKLRKFDLEIYEFMKIRKGTAQDMTAVLTLIKELARFENEPDAVETTVEDLIKDGFGTHPLFQVLVAQTENEIVGMALYYYRYSTWKGKTIHLEDLIVKEKLRSQGIGAALYAKVIEQAQTENIKRVEWAVLDWNQNAIDFYTKTGADVLKNWHVVQMNEKGIANFVEKN